jgi:signal transduction histidine kinase
MRVAQLHGRYAATAAERNRMARELHDNLLQGTAGALMQLKALRKRFVPDDEAPPASDVAGEIQGIEEVLAANVEETRRSIWELREQSADLPALAPALTRVVQRMRRPGVDIRLTVQGEIAPLPAHVGQELVRIAQEAITNALEHAHPRTIELGVRQHAGQLVLTIGDDGAGFDPGGAPGAAAGHFGLTGMRERAAALGDFNLTSEPGRGTRIEVTVRTQEPAE